MQNDALDLALARHVRQIGLVTPEQITSALQAQAKSLQSGTPVSFGDALIQLGLLTPAQRETLEKKVKEQQAGVQQLGPYKLMKKLGEGGMGAVYLALDPSTQRHVAVKVLPRHLGSNPEFVKRFQREAEAATRLKHPNIIGAFATGEDLGYHYYVMEYCEGRPLDSILAVEKQLSVQQALGIAVQTARGLKYAHDQGIIHRDIKPSNLILANDGTTKILDLGLSKNLEDSAVSFKTVTGAVLGTPHYISPEQAQGEKNVDGRTDIYSLGATLYHLLTGKVPFDGATALEILSKHVNTVLTNPQDLREDIPDATVHVLLRMMAKEPADRYPDCGPLIADLEEAAAGRTPKTHLLEAARTTIAPSARRSVVKKRSPTLRRVAAPRSNRVPIIAAGAVVAAAVVILVVALSGGREPVSVPAPPTIGTKLPPPTKTPEPSQGSFNAPTWEKSVADLTPEAQLKSVISRLKDLNPGYDGSEKHETGHGRISRLELDHVALRDLSPLRALAGLSQLVLAGTSVTDLSPLKDSKIVSLTCSGLKSADLPSIRGMKELKILSLKSTPTRDLSPLSGMELWQLNLKGTGADSLAPLRQLKLRELLCDFDARRDSELLKSMAGIEKINDLPAEEFWRKENPSEAPAVAGPDQELRSVLARLKQLNPDFDGRATPQVLNGTVTELALSALGVTDLSPLRTLQGLRKLDTSGYWDNVEKKQHTSALKDLGPLRALKLEGLSLHHTSVVDLEPVRNMRLEMLDVSSTEVRDLSPLRGMPLRKLDLSWTHVRDLSPLQGMPLTELRLETTDVTDFSLLRSLPLRELTGNFDLQKHRALLTEIRTLESVNGLAVADFLKAGAAPPPAAPKPGPKPAAEAGAWKNAIDLMMLIDPPRDTVTGIWKKENGRLISEPFGNAVLRIPYEPPPEYDFKIAYTRAGGKCSTAQFLQREGRGFFWEMGGWGNVNSGFATIGGKGSKDNGTSSSFVPRDGVRYVSVIQVRRDRVTALLDDKKISEWLPSMGEITTDMNWCVDVPNLIGIGNCDTLTTFDLIQVREVVGKGRIKTSLTTPLDVAFINQVSRLPAAEQVKRVVEKLKELNPLFDGEYSHRIESDRVVEFEVATQRITDVWPIRALITLKKLDLEHEKSVLADIGALKGLKLQELGLSHTRVSDLSPLQGMPLIHLQIQGTPVRDLAPLRALPLQQLECEGIPASDYAPLKSIRSLKTVNDQPVAEFLKAAGSGWRAIFDGRTLDCLRNPKGWKFEKGAIANEPDEANSAQTKFEFENGELRIRFETKGLDSCTFRVRQTENGACGVFFDGISARALDGKPHELIFSCRGPQVVATMDGKTVPLYENRPVRTGCFQFNGATGSLRITGIEFRAAP